MEKPMPRFPNIFTAIVICLPLLIILPDDAFPQLPRERAVPDRPVDRIFWAPQNVGISTTETLEAKNLNSSVLHTFGLVKGGIDRFFGLDDGANTRIGLEYGVTDRFSLGIGRMTLRKVVDIHGKIRLMEQTVSGSTPFDVTVEASTGISTVPSQGLEFSERLSYLLSVMAARKMDRLSVQLSPMYAHFNLVPGDNPKGLFGVGLLAQFELNDRFALSAEYLPVIGDRFRNTDDSMAVALNIDTGGHIFQIFFASSQFHNEQFIMANNRDRFWEGEFRFGFNIHRLFGLGR
jgi:hypothetical protein